MCVALIGGAEGIDDRFRELAARAGFDLWFLDGPEAGMAARIGDLDALVIITNKVSAGVKDEALNIAKAKCIPAFCTTCEGAALCGITLSN